MNFLSLPPELHQIIFDYAAYSPDKLSSPAIYNTPKRDKQATLLPLICKQLCPIAQTIIWRHLSISDLTVSSSDLDGLFVSLTQHEPRVFDDVFIIPPPAQCVQSLYLSHFFRRSHGAQVASLIQLCPQLINLHIVDASYNLTPVLERAFLAKGDKLQRFYLQIDAHFERRIIRSQPVGIERTLQLLPNLRSLSVQATSELQLSMCSTPWTSLRHLDIDSYALAPETIESILQSNADTIDEISIDNESIKSYQPYQTLMESSDATAFHFMGPPDDDQMLQRTLSNFGRLYSLTLVGTLSFDWLGSAPL